MSAAYNIKMIHVPFTGITQALTETSTGRVIAEFDGALELAVRSWTRTDDHVREIVSKVDRERIDYHEKQFRAANLRQMPNRWPRCITAFPPAFG